MRGPKSLAGLMAYPVGPPSHSELPRKNKTTSPPLSRSNESPPVATTVTSGIDELIFSFLILTRISSWMPLNENT